MEIKEIFNSGIEQYFKVVYNSHTFYIVLEQKKYNTENYVVQIKNKLCSYGKPSICFNRNPYENGQFSSDDIAFFKIALDELITEHIDTEEYKHNRRMQNIFFNKLLENQCGDEHITLEDF